METHDVYACEQNSFYSILLLILPEHYTNVTTVASQLSSGLN